MKKIQSAEILCVGTELLLGDIVNTNAAYLSRKLAELGISVYHQSVVGDNPERLKKALFEAAGRCDLIITSGGLGPTYDDLTKETIAEFFGKSLVRNEEV
ncbi:MAG: competence/damage-inducible protein A, partial [Clostridia bacterium]|nr:competence/damage-inducible protein A [Clostridia bacterium]